MNKIVLGISIGLLAVVAFIFTTAVEGNGEEMPDPANYDYEIVKEWELPDVLREVSAIEYLGGNSIACIQDEDGIIFIYDLQSSKITAQIDFHGGGDYEGLASKGRDAYILRSDGAIFEVQNFQGGNPKVKEHKTSLTSNSQIDLEGLCLDEKNNRLLIAAKHNPEESGSKKNVFAFDLQKEEVAKEPVFELAMEDPAFEKIEGKQENKFSPSEIEIHPASGKYYFLDGRSPKLLIADPETGVQKLYMLNEEEFRQPEGLTFKPDGTLYISNEGGKGIAMLYEVTLKN